MTLVYALYLLKLNKCGKKERMIENLKYRAVFLFLGNKMCQSKFEILKCKLIEEVLKISEIRLRGLGIIDFDIGVLTFSKYGENSSNFLIYC